MQTLKRITGELILRTAGEDAIEIHNKFEKMKKKNRDKSSILNQFREFMKTKMTRRMVRMR